MKMKMSDSNEYVPEVRPESVARIFVFFYHPFLIPHYVIKYLERY